MKKQDYIDLIRVAEAILRLEEGCKILNGGTFDNGEGSEVYAVWDILRRNAAKCYQEDKNLDIDFENHERFSSIIQDSNLSVEEKYERLING